MRLFDMDSKEDYLLDGKYKVATPYAPLVDVVEVVRCKDCRYYQDNNNGYPHNECRWRTDETPDETDFCSFGEREGE